KVVPGYENVPIVVNSPLTYKGITFYQSSYGPAGEGSVYHLSVRSKNGGAPVKLTARQGENIPLAGGGSLQVIEATQDVRPFMRMYSGPAIRVAYAPPGGSPQSVVLLRDYPDLDMQRGGEHIFTYDSADEKYFTGLQVAKDPGVWVVWVGCALMIVGICIAFFLSHKRIWVRVTNGRVTVGGTASKNQAAFELLFENLIEKMKKV
ncbi:MAG: cytochrome c biogenesis protein ResB, partial [Geobacter sp.]